MSRPGMHPLSDVFFRPSPYGNSVDARSATSALLAFSDVASARAGTWNSDKLADCMQPTYKKQPTMQQSIVSTHIKISFLKHKLLTHIDINEFGECGECVYVYVYVYGGGGY